METAFKELEKRVTEIETKLEKLISPDPQISHTQPAGKFKRDDYIVIQGRPCKVIETYNLL